MKPPFFIQMPSRFGKNAKKTVPSYQSVDAMVLKRIPEHHTWVETVFNVVKYLAINGQPFRGGRKHRLFLRTIWWRTFPQFLVFKIDPKEKEIAERLPANTKFTSADIQNEVIIALQNKNCQ